jgi:transposase InsO family protein
MREACSLVWSVLVLLFQSRASLGAEILILRHQLNIQRRHLPTRLTFSAMDRLIFVGLSRLAPSTLNALNALTIVKPETVVRWHRAGFRSYWRWKSRPRSGRPTVAVEIRRLIREMSIANPLWGAPRIHGELLKLGIDIGQTCVAKYMVKRREPPSQGWRTFIRNHADGIAAMDMFVVPTISFRLLYGLLIMGHGRRHILWFGVTAHPTAEWIANRVTEACGWEQARRTASQICPDLICDRHREQAPRYLIRDRDRAYGEVFIRRLRSMGIRDRPTSPRSPWQNGFAERLIGSIRRECLDHVVVFGERHLRHVLLSYMNYYNETRTHLSLDKESPLSRTVERAGRILCRPVLGGLHHKYVRV